MLNNTVITNNKRNIKLILEYDGSGYAAGKDSIIPQGKSPFKMYWRIVSPVI